MPPPRHVPSLLLLLLACSYASLRASTESPPPGVRLSLPPFSNSTMTCSFDPSINAGKVEPMPICVHSYPNPDTYVYLCDDDQPVSARYQYRNKVQLWKRGSRYAASFSTRFTVEASRDAESEKEGFFGGGLAFAITPSMEVHETTMGQGSLGLFAIDAKTGRPLTPSRSPKTVAVEIDLDRDNEAWDPPVPHLGLDLNSLRSSASSPLWDNLVDRKFAVFVDYDASTFLLSIRLQNITSNASTTPDRWKSKLVLSYPGLDLSRYVDEFSYVGFSSRVPVTTNGVYYIYNWEFSTKWVIKRQRRRKS